jgi:catechol 2,3-dioxygenase-like lactoylglutathione lyase family enzyme
MNKKLETLVDAYSDGRLSRRQLLAGLGSVVAAASLGSGSTLAEAPTSTFRSLGLNHIALKVSDIPRSRDFYAKHFGARPLQESQYNCFMGVGENHFVGLFKSDSPGLAHYSYTIADYDPAASVRILEQEGLSPRRREDRVYFDDPDGIEIQISSQWGDYPGPRP